MKTGGRRKKVQLDRGQIVHAFARQLREIRQARGMSQVDLARESGVNVSYVGRLERAEREPGIELVGRIAIALRSTISELLPIETADPLPLMKEQARRHFELILTSNERSTFFALNPWLALMAESLSRKTKS
jgi:transcriptional regulator with XRE-family HTH domain